jgi:hypothetical protein
MGKCRKFKPPTLQELVDLYNDSKISIEELTEKAIPLLEQQRASQIFYFMGQLASDSPQRYHISSPHHGDLWRDAIAAYDAKTAAELATKPSVRMKIEETVRRVEATFNQAEDQSVSV